MRSKRSSLTRAALAVSVACLLPPSPCRAGSFSVLDFGAVGDGSHDDTVAVRATLAAAAAAGPSSVLFPAGFTFLTGAFNLSSDLVVEIAGTVLAWPGSEGGHYWLGPELPWFGETTTLVWQSFIHSRNASNITLLGGGVVDGNGDAWWACGCSGGDPASAPCLGYDRPRLVHTVFGSGLTIRDLTFRNSPMWNLRPSWFDNVHITNVTILSPISSPNKRGCNTDGIDPDCVQDAIIEDSYISVGDDAIAVKSGLDWLGRQYGRPSRNITFRNMRIGEREKREVRGGRRHPPRTSSHQAWGRQTKWASVHTHPHMLPSTRAGTGHGISIGSEMSGGVQDILFENFILNGTEMGPRIKSERGRGSAVQNVTFRNITLYNVGSAFQITEVRRRVTVQTSGGAVTLPAHARVGLYLTRARVGAPVPATWSRI